MEFQYIPADQFCDSVRDGTHDTPKPTQTGYKLVTGKHIKNGTIDPTDAYFISKKDFEKINERSLVEQWDVVMSMIGTVGETAVVLDHPQYAIKNVALFKCGGSELKGRWLSYYLKSPIAIGHMTGNQKGSSQQFLSLKQLRSLPIAVTDTRYMQRVIDILSPYDSLIETKHRQIKLLEEAAQRLYREWFVDLRFPGHENVPVVDGVPKGWRFGELIDIAKENGRKERKENRDKYCYYLPIDCLPQHSLAYIVENDIALAESSLVGFDKDDILFGAMRPYFHKVVVARDKGLTRSTCFVINTNYKKAWSYLLMLLFSKDTIDYATKISVGTTMPYVRWKDFSHMPIQIPTEDICELFENVIRPIICKVCLLAESCERLSEARDRLLPKLMSGEIAV